MPLIKKKDVQNYFSSRGRTGIHLQSGATQPKATGSSVAEPVHANPDTAHSVAEPLKQPSSPASAKS
jgi:hypothetical protein